MPNEKTFSLFDYRLEQRIEFNFVPCNMRGNVSVDSITHCFGGTSVRETMTRWAWASFSKNKNKLKR
jgi:hypothetical protein